MFSRVPVPRLLLYLLVCLAGLRCAVLLTEQPRFGRGRERPERPVLPTAPRRETLPVGRGELPWPVHGVLVGTFGPRVDPKYKTTTRSQGIDIATVRGVPVTAVDSGRVSFADQFMGHGRMVIIDHGRRCHSLYSRLGDIRARVGDRIGRSDTIGFAGDTLHFEFRVSGRSVDPLDWLRPR